MARKKTETVDFVTKKEFDEVKDGMSRILDLLEKKATEPVGKVGDTLNPPADQKEVTKASANADTERVPSEYEEKAREILGDAIDHVELFYPRRGGTIFTVVVKKEKSNAPQAYLQFYKEDRRSRDIGNEGIEGIEQWCKLIKQNLSRPK